MAAPKPPPTNVGISEGTGQMTKLTQSRKRTPLFEGSPMLSFSKSVSPERPDTVSLMMRADVETPGGKATYFDLEIPVSEFVRVNRFVRDRQPTHDYMPTGKANQLAVDERRKDAANNLTWQEQQAKALEMALNMLKAYMPHDEQDENGTLAYIASLVDLAPLAPRN